MLSKLRYIIELTAFFLNTVVVTLKFFLYINQWFSLLPLVVTSIIHLKILNFHFVHAHSPCR